MAWARGALVLGLGFLLGRYVLPVGLPFAAAFALALVLEPLASLLERLGLPRTWATLTALASFLAAGSWLLGLATWAIWSEAEGFLRHLPHYYRVAQEASLSFGERMGLVGPDRFPTSYWQEPVREAFSFVSRLVGETAAGLAHVPEFALSMAMALLAAFFLTRDWRPIRDGFAELLPAPARPSTLAILARAARALTGYLRAQLLLIATTTLLVTAGLFVLGSRYAFLLGLAAGLLDIVPVLGATAILLPWGTFLVLTGHLAAGMRLLALLALVGAIREVVETKVVGGQVGLHPLAALLSMYFGVKVFGPLGIAVGPILVSTGWAALVPDRPPRVF